MADELNEVRGVVLGGNAVIGSERTLKLLRDGKVTKIFVAANAPQQVKDDIAQYSALAQVPVVHLDVRNVELGTLCKKPFSISVIGVTA